MRFVSIFSTLGKSVKIGNTKIWRIVSSEFHARLFVDALLSPAGKGLTSWLSFVVSNCYVVTFPDCVDS